MTSKTPTQHRTDAFTQPAPKVIHRGQELEMRPLSAGTLNLLQRVGNPIFSDVDESELTDAQLYAASLEVIYIFTGPLDQVRRACFGERLDFDLAVQEFAEGIELADFDAMYAHIEDQKSSTDAAIVEPKPDTDVDEAPKESGQSGSLD